MTAPIDLKQSQNNAQILSDHTDTCLVDNKERYARTQHQFWAYLHPLLEIALYKSIVKNYPEGIEHDGRYPTC